MECKKDSLNGGPGGARETRYERVAHRLKVMCHTDVVAPIVTNRFPYFRRTSSFFDSKQSGLL